MELVNTQPPAPEATEQTIAIEPQNIAVTSQGIQILIPLDKVQKAFQEHMDQLLSGKDRYNNPVKKAVEDIFSTYGEYKNDELRKVFNEMVASTMKSYMQTPGFHLQLGQAMAEEMAREAVKKLNK